MTYQPRRGSRADTVIRWMREQPVGVWVTSREIEQATGVPSKELSAAVAKALDAGALDYRRSKGGRWQSSYRLASASSAESSARRAVTWPPTRLDEATARIAPMVQAMCMGTGSV